MWRGVTRWKPVLSGATMAAGRVAEEAASWCTTRSATAIDAEGRQLVNWLWEIETPDYKRWDWNRPARVEDFIAGVEDWKFDWLDVPAFFRAADVVLEYPMVDKDPLPAWSFGRVTLLGDAAHPMYPRGSNGAGQAILDAKALAECLDEDTDVAARSRPTRTSGSVPTANVVLENRRNPPDAILREIYERTGDRPFERIEAVISRRGAEGALRALQAASPATTSEPAADEIPPPPVPRRALRHRRAVPAERGGADRGRRAAALARRAALRRGPAHGAAERGAGEHRGADGGGGGARARPDHPRGGGAARGAHERAHAGAPLPLALHGGAGGVAVDRDGGARLPPEPGRSPSSCPTRRASA